MKTIKPSVYMPFSDAGIEEAIRLLHENQGGVITLVLNVSVFNANYAIGMLIDDRTFADIRLLEVSRHLSDGQFKLIDKINDVMVDGSNVS